MMSREQGNNWLRGDLPTWVAVGMLTVIGWGTREAYMMFRDTLRDVVRVQHIHAERLAVLESSQSAHLRESKK